MDFDKLKVYGDTFISDGLVSFLQNMQEISTDPVVENAK